MTAPGGEQARGAAVVVDQRALTREVVAELVGTALLLAAVVGSGIMASTRSPADEGLQLLEAALATGMALAAIIMAVGPVSGAHLNPAVTLAERLLGGGHGRWRGLHRVGAYVAAQVAGGALGVVAANLMFGEPAVSVATTSRTGAGQWLGEGIATYGLVLVIFLMVRDGRGASTIGPAVGAYVAAAHFFTSSTSFANPAVTLARTLSDTFAGVAPVDVAAFVLAQLVGAVAAVATVRLLRPTT